jgi:hypothetical protein
MAPPPDRPGIPSFDDTLAALLEGNAPRAAALFAERALADPTDRISRANRAIALYAAERWADAAPALEAEIARAGFDDVGTVPALFYLGYCRLQLGQIEASLAATTAFLDLSNEDHPWYLDAIENTACAWERLAHGEPAASLRSERWARERIIARSYRLLGVRAAPRPPRDVDWYADDD